MHTVISWNSHGHVTLTSSCFFVLCVDVLDYSYLLSSLKYKIIFRVNRIRKMHENGKSKTFLQPYYYTRICSSYSPFFKEGVQKRWLYCRLFYTIPQGSSVSDPPRGVTMSSHVFSNRFSVKNSFTLQAGKQICTVFIYG